MDIYVRLGKHYEKNKESVKFGIGAKFSYKFQPIFHISCCSENIIAIYLNIDCWSSDSYTDLLNDVKKNLYGFWLLLWYLQTFLTYINIQNNIFRVCYLIIGIDGYIWNRLLCEHSKRLYLLFQRL